MLLTSFIFTLTLFSHIFTLLCFLPLPLIAHALILNQPQAGPGYIDIISSGTVLVSWITQPTDPPFIMLAIQDIRTLYCPMIWSHVSAALGNVTEMLDTIVGNQAYMIKASQAVNSTTEAILAYSPPFIVSAATRSTLAQAKTASLRKMVSSTQTVTTTDTVDVYSTLPTATTANSNGVLGKERSPTTTIIIACISGLVFLALVVGLVLCYRRQKRQWNEARALQMAAVPFMYDPDYTQPPKERHGCLEETIKDKTIAQKRLSLFSKNTQHRGRSQSRVNVNSPTESVSRLRQQIEVMSERVRHLEAQSNMRDLESSLLRLIGRERSQLPPGYSVIIGSDEQNV
ncbi:hypothetical protein H2248_010170 [Termitomyces sp. 'cryptogamus']|nr:hypothetical protein H2248_010170 [Termitomyces sp. 'cryptogamus']